MDKRTFVAIALVFILMPTGCIVFSSPVSGASPGNILDVSYDHGRLVDITTGFDYNGGVFTDEMSLQFIPNWGYEFLTWQISGSVVYTVDYDTVTIKSIEGPASLSVATRNYSTSQELINVIDVDNLAEPSDELVLAWSFKSGSLDMSGGVWKGMPCTPLIVGDYTYIRAAGRLYQIDITSGTVINQVTSGSGESYYHYLSYGNGVIFDTLGHVAYDLDLNYLYDIPVNLAFATYHNGFFYGCLSQGNSRYTMYKTSLDENQDLVNNVKVNLFNGNEQFKIFAQYGQFTNVLFVGDWFFFLQADVGGSYRALSAFNVVTEESRTCILTGFEGMYWDDGWLTYYDGYFYLTAYVAGLFGGIPSGAEEKRSSLMWVKFDFETGDFEAPSFKKIQTSTGQEFYGIASGLVIYNGRGYLNVRALGDDTLGGSDDTGSKMIAYDIEKNGEPIPKCATPSVMTHGGIVVNTAHVDDGLIHVYLIPYNVVGQAVLIFTDQLVDGEWVLKSTSDRLEMKRTDWCSQCIRAGPNGEMLFYVDSGYIDCYVPADKYYVNVITVEGECANSKTDCGSNVQEIIKKIYPSIEIKGKSATLGDKKYQIYGLNEVSNKWVLVTNPTVGTYSGVYKNGITESTFRQIALVEESSSITLPEDGEQGWYYFDGEYKKASFSDLSSLRDSVGCSWFYLDSKPSNGSVLIDLVKQVNREGSITVELPSMLESSFIISDDSVISVVKNGNLLTITGLKEKATTLIIEIDGRLYPVSVNVLPKVTIVDGNRITESDREIVVDGGILHTVSVTTESSTRMDRTVTETLIDAMDNVISTRDVIESAYNGITMDGRNADYVERSERLVENDVVKKDISFFSETIIERLDIGVMRTIIIESTENRITGDVDIIKTETTEYAGYNVSTVTVEHFAGGSTEPTYTSTENVYDSKMTDFTVECENGVMVINLDENGTVDITAMIDAALEDTSIGSISVNAGSIVNSRSTASAAEAGASMTMSFGVATISMGADTLKNLASVEDTVWFSVESGADMTAKQQSSAGDARVFSIVMRCGDVEQHDFGTFTMSIACDIEVQEGKELKVWRIDDYGKKTYASNVTYSNGIVTFDGDHLSIYAIGYESESPQDEQSNEGSGGNGVDFLLFGGIGAVAIIVLFGGVMIIRGRH